MMKVLYPLLLPIIRNCWRFFRICLSKGKQKQGALFHNRATPRAQPAPLPSNEADRLKALHCYNILDTPPEAEFDDLTALAAQICDAPVALISLIDTDRQWFKSKVGVEATETPRDLAFCTHTILKPDQLLVVPNTLKDRRFATHPLVISHPNIRFYAGVPLVTPDGLPLGTICVLDIIPRHLTSQQKEALRALGRQVITQMELRINLAKLERTIAKRKQAESALRQQGEWLEVTLSSIGDAVIATDMRATITFMNPWAEVLTGWLAEEAVGRKIDEVVHILDEQTRRPVFIPVEQVIQERVVVEWSKYTVLLARDGREIPIDYSCAPILSISGSMYGAVLAFRNMNARRKAEKERLQLLEREQAAREEAEAARNRTTNILESITDGFFAVDKEWQFTYLNPQAEPLMQRSRHELLGKKIWDEFPETVGLVFFEQFHKAVSQRVAVEFEEFYPPLNTWFAVHAYPAKDGLSVYLQDITKRKQAEEEVFKALEREKELNELKSRFIAMASHEFRTPLTAIQGSADLLEIYGYKLSNDKKLIHLHRIQDHVQNMVRLLDDVLLIGKAEAGKMEFQQVNLDLEQYCYSLVEELQLTASSQHKIAFSILGKCTHACMDEKLLRHILTNLLSNAIKYSPQGGTVNFELACGESEAVFQIKDQGIGIPPEDIHRMFESFHRAKNVGKIAGTGLGLAIVKRSVDSHGGEITVTSEVGVGTAFTVRLPLNEKRETAI